MNQEERDIRLFEYWQGELLSPEEVREVESWLGEKGENRRYFEDLQREFLRQRWVMRERLVSRKGEHRFRQVARKRAMLRRAVAVAACVDVPLAESGVIHHGSSKARLFLSTGDVVELGKERKSLREQQAVAIDVEQEGMVAYRDSVTAEETGNVVYNKLVVNRGGEYRIVLADGSEVWVNSEVEGRGLFQGAGRCGPPVYRGGERGRSGGCRYGIQRKFPEGEGRGVRVGEGTSGSGERDPAGDVDAESTGRL